MLSKRTIRLAFLNNKSGSNSIRVITHPRYFSNSDEGKGRSTLQSRIKSISLDQEKPEES